MFFSGQLYKLLSVHNQYNFLKFRLRFRLMQVLSTSLLVLYQLQMSMESYSMNA
jgi:hypothetical protein